MHETFFIREDWDIVCEIPIQIIRIERKNPRKWVRIPPKAIIGLVSGMGQTALWSLWDFLFHFYETKYV